MVNKTRIRKRRYTMFQTEGLDIIKRSPLFRSTNLNFHQNKISLNNKMILNFIQKSERKNSNQGIRLLATTLWEKREFLPKLVCPREALSNLCKSTPLSVKGKSISPSGSTHPGSVSSPTCSSGVNRNMREGQENSEHHQTGPKFAISPLCSLLA